eukprot:11773035-Alexandrium_andersonii.AAC.1
MQQPPQRRSIVPEEVPHVFCQEARRHLPGGSGAPRPVVADRLGKGTVTLDVPRRVQRGRAA